MTATVVRRNKWKDEAQQQMVIVVSQTGQFRGGDEHLELITPREVLFIAMGEVTLSTRT